MNRSKLFIENGWIKEWKRPMSFLLFQIPQHRKVSKVRDNLISEQMVEAYNEKHQLT